MALGSGLGSQFGFANEASAWGTRAAADHFLPVVNWDIQKRSERATSQGIRTGSYVELLSQHVETHEFAEATIELDVFNKQMGLLFQGLMGAAATPTVMITGAAWSQTHTLSAINPGDKRSLTLQGGTPLRSGAVQVKEIQGARVRAAEFSCEVGGTLTASFELVGKKYDGSQSLVTASYPTGLMPFRFKDGVFKTGTYSSEAALTGVRAVSLRIERSLDEPFYYGGSGYMTEPVMNGFTQITGTVTADYDTAAKAALEDRALALTSTSLVWEFVQSTAITGTTYPTVRFTIPGAVFEAQVAVPDGVQEITNDFTFKAFDDGTNAASIYTISADSAL